MIKHHTVPLFLIGLLVLMFVAPNGAAAATSLAYYGTTSESSYLWANTSTGADIFTSVSFDSCSNNASLQFFKTEGGKATYMSRASISSGSGSLSPPSGTTAIKLLSNDGAEIYLTKATTTNSNSSSISFENDGNCASSDSGGDSGSESGGSGGSNTECDACAMFACPGWGQYMGELEDIKNAIPPAPNWKNVSETFRDTITPKIKADLQDVLGKAPDLPDVPDMPAGIDDGNLKQPEGKEAAGLGDSSFDENDIKSGDEIEFKEDDSGGFKIDNPLDTLPDQDEYRENVPEEQENPTPEEPEVEVERPGQPEVEVETPTEPEIEVETPGGATIEPTTPGGATIEPERPGAPNVEVETPTAPEIEVEAPEPEGESSSYPVPGSGSNSAPTPGGSAGSAPVPNRDSYYGPVPGGGSSSGPVPSRGSSSGPVPNQ